MKSFLNIILLFYFVHGLEGAVRVFRAAENVTLCDEGVGDCDGNAICILTTDNSGFE